jgi:Spy/CpxP family protein refolding chaperone
MRGGPSKFSRSSGMGYGEGFRGGMSSGFRIAPPGMWWKNPTIVQKLTLAPDQVKKMDDIFQASRLRLVDLKANVERQNLLLEPMLSANPPDTVKTLAQIDKVAQARADLEKENARMLLGIRGVLTPDQWTKLRASGPDGSGRPGSPAGQPGGYGGGGFGGSRGPRGPAPGGSIVAPAPQF